MMLLRGHDGDLAGASDHAGDGNGHILLLEVMLIDCTVQKGTKLPEISKFSKLPDTDSDCRGRMSTCGVRL